MSNRLSNTTGERVNTFDGLSVQTVKTFNDLFPDFKITSFEDNASVEILEPTSDNSRFVLINGIKVKHKFAPNLFFGIEKDEFMFMNDNSESSDVLGYESED